MITIPHTDARLRYAGRWVDFGDSHGCAWQAGQIRFKVSGTSVLSINAYVSGTVYCVANIDGGPPQSATFPGGSGAQSISFPVTGSGEHTVVVKLFGLPDEQFNLALYCRLTSIGLSDGAALSAWTGGPIVLQLVGDSWMASQNDWPHLLPVSRYAISPVAFGGATAATLNARYDYTSSGVVAPVDAAVQGVIVNSGVNDTWGGVSTAAYQSSMASLVDKIRARQPAAKIIMLGSPRNLAAGRAYNQYDAVNAEIAAARSNVVFIPIPNELADSLAWNTDAAHINYQGGLVDYAAWVDEQIYPSLAQEMGGSLWMRTPSGLVCLSAEPVDPTGITGNVALKVPGGYLGMGFEQVEGAVPTDALLMRSSEGLFRAITVSG